MTDLAAPGTVPRRMAGGRSAWIEWLRLLSALGIVWFHAQSAGWLLAYAGLSVFLILSAFFAAGDRPAPLARTAGRLLVPWAAWSLLFAALAVARHKPPAADIATLFAGTAPHLWYIPFLLGLIIMLRGLRATPLWPYRAILAGLGLVGILAAWPTYRPWSLGLGAPFMQYMNALPPVLIGVALAGTRTRPTTMAAVALVLAASLLAFVRQPGQTALLSYAIGIACCAAALMLTATHPRVSATASRAGAATLGIYLVHPLPLALLRHLMPGHPPPPAVPALAFLISAGIVEALRRWGGRPGALIVGAPPPDRVSRGAGSPA